jgi:hypothetical protein
MILFVFLICHTLLVMAMYMMAVAGILKVDEEMFVMIICIPFWGALSALMITYLIKRGKVGSRSGNLEAMRGGFQDPQDLRVETGEAQNIVPLEDALIMDDSSVRRSVMLDVLMSDARGYMPVINQARMNDDVEVVHYATTAMVELSKEYELKLQEFSTEYAENPTKEGLLDEYVEFLGQYIASGMIQGQLLEIQRNTYQQLLSAKVVINPNIDDYEKLVRAFLASRQYPKADASLGIMEEQWPGDERNWLLRFRYYVETGSGQKIKDMIQSVRDSGEYYSKDIREIIEFWDRDERQAPA